jgi:phosphatidylinositol alpha-mannosyltransferase
MVNLRHFREPAKAKVALNHPNIVFLGRLEPRKGCMELLKAIAKLKKTHGFESTFYICGAGSDQAKLQAFARQHKLTDDVKFVGFVSEIKKLAYLQAADIAVFPSLGGESFGIVLLEAMAASKGIVIGGDNPGYRAVLGTLPGALTNPKNTTEFADKLHELLGNQRLRSSLHKAQSKLVEQYDVAKVGPEIMSVYRHAIAKRSVQGHN